MTELGMPIAKGHVIERELGENEIKIEIGRDTQEEVVDSLAERLHLEPEDIVLGKTSHPVVRPLMGRQDTVKRIIDRRRNRLLGALLEIGPELPDELKNSDDAHPILYFTGPNKFYGVIFVTKDLQPTGRAWVAFQRSIGR